MKVFEVYYYKDHHKGWGYGGFKDYIVIHNFGEKYSDQDFEDEYDRNTKVLEDYDFNTITYGIKEVTRQDVLDHLDEAREEYQKVSQSAKEVI